MNFKQFVMASVVAALVLFSGSLVKAERPNLGVGGSNWTPPDPHFAQGGGITTTDANVLTPAQIVAALVGPGVSVSNISLQCANVGAGTFSGGAGIIGFNNGVILSSGNIASVSGGSNVADDTTTNNGTPGDPDLDALIPGFATHDSCVLEFDFECENIQAVQFQYVFSSEEYNEYVFTNYNDVFGFFLNGVNIALVPGAATTPVAIDNVNCNNPYNPPTGNNCNLYRNNDCTDIPPNTFPCDTAIDTEMDGLTLVFTATGAANPGVNHIKLAIADAGDFAFDSNVFLQGSSFKCSLPTGACCNTSNFTCQNDVLEVDCQLPNQVWNAGLDCDVLDPPCLAMGPCCLNGSCFLTTAPQCSAQGGTPLGSGVCEGDADQDGTDGRCGDNCPNDPNKLNPGVCGCGTSDVDTDGDGTLNCHDGCPNDPNKTAPGVCGCGTPDVDSDMDGVLNCQDGCPNDPNKTSPGVCGCGTSDQDTDGDSVADCHDVCPGQDDTVDADNNGQPDCRGGGGPIPTVSEWGLVVMALLLLIGGKIYFNRRQAVA